MSGLAGSIPAAAQNGAPNGDWVSHGGENGTTKYSGLREIRRDTVGRLATVWEWETADAPILAEFPLMQATNFEVTPLAIDGILYGTTSLSQAFAVDGATGETIWVYDPLAYDTSQRGRGGLAFINRGVVVWGEGDDRRLFFGTLDARLVALDARTGRLIEEFGESGQIDMREGIPRITNPRDYSFGSAPIVCGDVVIAGARISDGSTRKSMPPGWVRGWDVRTGELRWTFHSVPEPGEFGRDTWGNDSASFTGGTNVWTLLSADDEAGLVYLPFGTPTSDFWGGERPGDNLFAESLVCLECATGVRRWHFQAVHHGLWDYDLPAPPVLADLVVEGRPIKALALVTKHGFTFVLDRMTGEPVWPIDERPVPQTDVAGEFTSPTQPFPTWPAPFEMQGVSEEDLIDLTPAVRAAALDVFDDFVSGPLFTPPSLQGTLLLPSYGGGANWPGAGLDPETGWLYVPSMRRTLVMKLVEPDPARSEFAYVLAGRSFDGPLGLPLVKPPWGSLTAINLNTGDHVWRVPNGGDGPIDHPALAGLDVGPLGTPGRAAVLVTPEIVFVTEGSGRTGSAIGGGPGLRALDKQTGEELWRGTFGGEITGVPMTFETAGRQIVIVAVGSEIPRLVALAIAP